MCAIEIFNQLISIFHWQVLEGVDQLLYSLLVLGCVTDSRGLVWLRSPFDLYLIETMPLFDHKEVQVRYDKHVILFFLRNQQAKSTMIHSQCQIHHC
jgi:hypothetical protein